MNDSSRTQGGLICVAVVVLGAWFLLALLQQSYWALAIPVAIVVFFVLGLTFWVGYTIATIRVEPDPGVEPPAGGDAGAPDARTGA
jgi:threonine/homoserine efflux transporter RhtA